jgi:Na+/H+-dicarboxylate symporter
MSKSFDSTKKRSIRKVSLPEDSERLMEVFATAKGIMAADGNVTQWTEGYPSMDIVKSDIEKDGGFVVEDDGKIVAYFAFLPSPEPTYDKIYDGKWLNDSEPYHVIHRIASFPEAHGIFQSIMEFCFAKEHNIRIDTHRDNKIMQHNIEKHGFKYCGIIHLANGDERLAYQKMTGKKKISLTAQIGIALVLAVIAGVLLRNQAHFVNEYIKPWGTIFLNLLKFIVVPLVLFSIMAGILSMNDVSKVGKLGLRTLIYFIITTLFAVTLGLVVPSLAKGFLPTIKISTEAVTDVIHTPHLSVMDQIVAMFPDNILIPVSSMAMMQVIVIALFFGIAMVHIGEKGEMARKVTLSFNDVVGKILEYIMALAPFGVFCMLTPVVVENGPAVLGSYAALLALAYFCFAVHAGLIYSSAVWILGGLSPLKFFKGMQPAMLFAFSSDSSVATLPYSMQCTEKLGVSKDIGRFVLSLGATINMDGVAIYLGVASVFMANCCGIDLTMSQYMAIAFASTIASIGTPGIPGGSLALMAMVFASAGIPVECVAVAAGIDRIIDMGRTVMSITGDASCAVVMQKFLGKNV